jgi:Ni,Fe-hydrogenase III small subunit
MFADAYGVALRLDQIVEPDIRIEGCPPHPNEIIAAFRSLTEL